MIPQLQRWPFPFCVKWEALGEDQTSSPVLPMETRLRKPLCLASEDL